MGLGKSSVLVLAVCFLAQYIPFFLQTKLPVLVNGTVAPGFEDVAEVFKYNFDVHCYLHLSFNSFVGVRTGLVVCVCVCVCQVYYVLSA